MTKTDCRWTALLIVGGSIALLATVVVGVEILARSVYPTIQADRAVHVEDLGKTFTEIDALTRQLENDVVGLAHESIELRRLLMVLARDGDLSIPDAELQAIPENAELHTTLLEDEQGERRWLIHYADHD